MSVTDGKVFDWWAETDAEDNDRGLFYLKLWYLIDAQPARTAAPRVWTVYLCITDVRS
jgi:hypothetical protein